MILEQVAIPRRTISIDVPNHTNSQFVVMVNEIVRRGMATCSRIILPPPGNSYLASRDGSMHRRCGDTICDCPPCVAHSCTVYNGQIFIRIGRQWSAWRILKNGDASISLRGCSCVKPHRKSGEDCDLFHRFESGSTRCASAWARTPWGYTFGEQTT